MDTSTFPSIVPNAGLTYRQTINESDKEFYWAALAIPRGTLRSCWRSAGDEIDKAVKAHPQHLRGLSQLSFAIQRLGSTGRDHIRYGYLSLPRNCHPSQQPYQAGDSIGQGHHRRAGEYDRHESQPIVRQEHCCPAFQLRRAGAEPGQQRGGLSPAGGLRARRRGMAWSASGKAQSAGVRTNLLICMGCAFFTLLSAVLAGDTGTNKGQVASNIVQGIGFLGAGLILHNKNRVSGLASAASIFVVASIGMACGAGLFLPAVIATGHRAGRNGCYRLCGVEGQPQGVSADLRSAGQRRDRTCFCDSGCDG